MTSKDYYYILLTAIFLSGCANQLPPTGGEKDEIPPEVIEFIPERGATNFNENSIEITFSEYVDKRSVQDAVFISPSVEGKMEYDWGGKSVEIIFEDSLRANTTYVVTVGTDVKDLNNSNKMAEAYNMAFSTGDEIDFCSVEGNIYDDNPEGAMVYAYMVTDTVPAPVTQKPDYLSQVGRSGVYKLLGMAPGKYRVFAFRDEFKDLIYNVGDDSYGVPFKDINLTKTDSLITDFDFLLSLEDTVVPHINAATMTDKNHILLEFSEPIDSSRLNSNNFFIYDSTDNKRLNVDYVFKGSSKNKELFIAFTDTLSEDNSNYLIVENLKDLDGNFLNREAIGFTVSTKLDTVPPAIIKKVTEYPNNIMDIVNPYVKIKFNDAFNYDKVQNAISFEDKDSSAIDHKINKVDDSSILVIANSALNGGEDYSLTVNLNIFEDVSGNKQDTVEVIKLKTIGELEFSGAAGSVLLRGEEENIYVALKNIADSKTRYLKKITTDYKFNFDRVKPGKYFIWSFIDKDSTGNYTFGSVEPFKYSERFTYYKDTLDLRARWPVGEILIEYE